MQKAKGVFVLTVLDMYLPTAYTLYIHSLFLFLKICKTSTK